MTRPLMSLRARDKPAGAEDPASSAAMADKFAALRDEIVARPGRPASASRYEFGEVFARGGLGQVRRAFDPVLGRTIAVKEMLSPAGGERFIREAQVTARLDHPAVVPVHDLGTHADGQPFYCMKLIDGRSLDAVIARLPTLAGRMVLLQHIVTAAEAVAFAHSKGILHRDIKPANILVGNFGETWVIDWGLTTYLEPDESSDTTDATAEESRSSRLTRTGEWMGTLPYMAPEQRHGGSIDVRADVYGLGAVLYHTLAGQRPYRDVRDADLLGRVTSHPPTDLERVMPQTPPELLAIVRKAMARDPGDRYADARAFIDDLRRFLDGRLVGAHVYRFSDVIRRWARRHRSVLSVAAVAVVLLAAVGIYGINKISAERDTAERHASDATEQRHAAEAARATAERQGVETRAALATRWEEEGRRRLLVERRPLDAIEPLRRAQHLAPERAYLATMLAQASRPLHALRCERDIDDWADAVVVHPHLPWMVLGSSRWDHAEVWDTDRCIRTMELTFSRKVRGMRFTPDGNELLVEVGDENRETIHFDGRTMMEMARTPVVERGAGDRIETHEPMGCGQADRDEVQSWPHASYPSGITVALDRSGDTRVWMTATGACVGIVAGHRVTKWRVVEVDETPHLLTLDGDARLSIWRILPRSLAHISTLDLDENSIFDFDAVQANTTLVTVGRDGAVRSWDLAKLAGPRVVVRAPILALHPDGAAVAVATPDGVQLRDLQAPASEVLEWPVPRLDALRWSNGALVARRGTTLFDWDPAGTNPPAELEVGHEFLAEGLEHDVFAGSPLVVVNGTLRSREPGVGAGLGVRIVDRSAGRSHTFDTPWNRWPSRPLLGADGTRLLVGAMLIDATTLKMMKRVDFAVFTPDGTEVLSLSARRRGLASHDARTGREDIIDPLPMMPHRRRGLADVHTAHLVRPGMEVLRPIVYSPSGAAFAVLGVGSDVTLWRERPREARALLAGQRLPPNRAVWSPDESRIVTCTNDSVARLWDTATGELLAEVEGVWFGASIVFSPVGPHLAIQEGSDRLTVVDIQEGVRLFAAATESLREAAFSPDGRRLLFVEAPPGAEQVLRAVEVADP